MLKSWAAVAVLVVCGVLLAPQTAGAQVTTTVASSASAGVSASTTEDFYTAVVAGVGVLVVVALISLGLRFARRG